MNKTKKAWAAGLIAALLATGATGWCASGNPVDITVTVTVSQLSITASNRNDETDTVAFGTKLAGSNSVAADPVSVTNSGNVTETYSLVIPSEPNLTWASIDSGSPAAEQYKLSAVFRAPAAAAPGTGDYDDNDAFKVGAGKTATGADNLAVNGDTGGDGTKGYKMAANANLYMWLKFHAPSATAITTQQSIVARITAATP